MTQLGVNGVFWGKQHILKPFCLIAVMSMTGVGVMSRYVAKYAVLKRRDLQMNITHRGIGQFAMLTATSFREREDRALRLRARKRTLIE